MYFKLVALELNGVDGYNHFSALASFLTLPMVRLDPTSDASMGCDKVIQFLRTYLSLGGCSFAYADLSYGGLFKKLGLGTQGFHAYNLLMIL